MLTTNLIGISSLLGWLYLALGNGKFWRPLLPVPSPDPDIWPSVDIIVPARNEADMLPGSLSSLLQQDYKGAWRVILVDDHSTDGTGDTAHKIVQHLNAQDRLHIINAPDLPTGWSGKVAAMQAGVTHSTADYVLFTDADIAHDANSLSQLVARAVDGKLDMTSRMVLLHCREFAEQLLIPAFVFFFAMLYPFEKANDEDSSVAAAAGGVMLVRRASLNHIGGLASLKSALIDDCTLAHHIKNFGGDSTNGIPARGRIELALTQHIRSIRPYPDIESIWKMIARSAFTQLRYSSLLLLGTVLGMGLLFVAPILLPLIGGTFAALCGMTTCLVMFALYLPMVRFYNRPFWWVLTLPAAALVYIGATIDSARLYWQGKGGQWKGRNQAS